MRLLHTIRADSGSRQQNSSNRQALRTNGSEFVHSIDHRVKPEQLESVI